MVGRKAAAGAVLVTPCLGIPSALRLPCCRNLNRLHPCRLFSYSPTDPHFSLLAEPPRDTAHIRPGTATKRASSAAAAPQQQQHQRTGSTRRGRQCDAENRRAFRAGRPPTRRRDEHPDATALPTSYHRPSDPLSNKNIVFLPPKHHHLHTQWLSPVQRLPVRTLHKTRIPTHASCFTSRPCLADRSTHHHNSAQRNKHPLTHSLLHS